MGNNATAINEQASLQRDKISKDNSENKLGISSDSRLASIYDIDSRGTGEVIDGLAKLTLNKQYTDNTVIAGMNPDFPNGHANFNYKGSHNMLSSANEASDKPSKLGPNLKSLSIDGNGMPIIPDGHTTSQSPTVTPSDEREDGLKNGFGVSMPRHNPGKTPAPEVSYIQRRDTEDGAPRLGEYIDTDKYDFEA